MGVTDKLVTFGSSRKGKIISWVLTIFASVIFFIGVLMSSIGAAVQTIGSLTISAPQISKPNEMRSSKNGNYIGYFLDVSSIKTAIVAKTDIPTSAPVVFRIVSGDKLVELQTNRISSGGSVVLSLKKLIDNKYYISDPDPNVDIDNIHIEVTCANRRQQIYVRVVPKLDDIKVKATLEGTIRDANGKNIMWIPETYLDMAFFNPSDPSTPTRYQSKDYRIHLTFSIFGSVIYDSEINRDYIDEDGKLVHILPDYQYFDYIETDDISSDISLFDSDSEIWTIISSPKRDNGQLTFKISCYYNGQYYFTDPDLLITIKGWQ